MEENTLLLIRGARFSEVSYSMSFPIFIEDIPYGEKGYLFKTWKDADEWIEMDRLELWLRNLNVHNHPYTLEQLRKRNSNIRIRHTYKKRNLVPLFLI